MRPRPSLTRLLGLLSALCLAAGGLRAGASIHGRVLSKGGQGVANAVVFLDEVNGNQGFSPPTPGPSMASHGMAFVPEVLAVLAGTTVSFPNDDEMNHNVFSLSKTKPFDLGHYGRGPGKSVTFDQSGLIRVYCNIHEDMEGYILVLGNPYFCLTDKDGAYRLEGPPQGSFTLVCWSKGELAQQDVILTQGKDVTVDAASDRGLAVNFNVASKKGSTRHKDKWGGMYLDRY